LQNGKARSNRAENLQLTARPRKGTSHRPGTPSKGRTFQRRGFHLGESPSERAQDTAGPGPLERATRGGQGHKVRIAWKRGSLAKGRKTQRARGHSKEPPGGSGPQVHRFNTSISTSPQFPSGDPRAKRRPMPGGVPPTSGGSASFSGLSTFPLAIAISPSYTHRHCCHGHFACKRVIAGHTKAKCTFDYQIDTDRVLDRLIGP